MRAELVGIIRPMCRRYFATEIVRVIEQGGWHRALSQRLTELEMKQDGLTTRLSDAPQDTPAIHPNIAETYRRRIERLTAALAHPDDALEAADALREVIDRAIGHAREKHGCYSTCKASLAQSSTRSAAQENPATSPTLTCQPLVCRSRSKPRRVPAIHVLERRKLSRRGCPAQGAQGRA